jgi:hypothetical protein
MKIDVAMDIGTDMDTGANMDMDIKRFRCRILVKKFNKISGIILDCGLFRSGESIDISFIPISFITDISLV